MSLAILILCLLMVDVEYVQLVSTGRAPPNKPISGVQLYLPVSDLILPDYSIVPASGFVDFDANENGIIDALFCQSANSDSNIGMWYYPDGTEVPTYNGIIGDHSSHPRPVYSRTNFVGQVALARNAGLAGVEGLYTCIIPDENGVNQTLVVGLYRVMTYNTSDGPDVEPTMEVSLISTEDTNSPAFTLNFETSNEPPTYVTCIYNESLPLVNITSNDLSREIVNGSESITCVTVTVRMKLQAGTYRCTVSNARVTDGTINNVTAMNSSSLVSITVGDAPSVRAVRLNTGLAHVRLSWSSVSEVIGYEVSISGNDLKNVAVTNDTMVDITSRLSLGVEYSFIVVSYVYGNTTFFNDDKNITSLTLTTPSVDSLTATTITNTSVSLTWSHPSFVPQSYSITRGCHRLCDSQSVTANGFNSISSPYESSGINPGSECSFTLRGVYGSNQTNLSTISATTLSSAPTSSVSNMTISSVEAKSVRVSWDEVPCNGQNGPITGYWLYYTNTTFNDSVNITGGDMREYILTSLAPYTNYSVRVRPYNDGGIGPTSNEIIQQTSEDVPGVVSNLVSSNVNGTIDTISISWDVPSIPNGIITAYEIHYISGTYNTTNTQYTIEGLLPNTLYTIEVRAYTSVGGGEWSGVITSTSQISNTSSFSISPINTTAVQAVWDPFTALCIGEISHYTIYYKINDMQSIRLKAFPPDINNTIIEGLDPDLNYTFELSVTYRLNGISYEGDMILPNGDTSLPPTNVNIVYGEVFAVPFVLLVIILLALLIVVVVQVIVIIYYRRRSTHHTNNTPEPMLIMESMSNNNETLHDSSTDDMIDCPLYLPVTFTANVDMVDCPSYLPVTHTSTTTTNDTGDTSSATEVYDTII